MSWLLNLYETYKANLGRVGEIEKKRNEQEYTLLPVSHTTQTAHIEVRVTEDGEYHSASVIDKQDAITLIPCTEDSASRAGAVIAPYPLHDKLSYVAGDYVAYGGEIKKEEPFSHYIRNLEAWANSPYAVDKVKSIYRYVSKGRLIQDLVEKDQILHVDANGRLIDKWDKIEGAAPKIFSAVAGEQSSAFVRFTVYSPSQELDEVWKDKEMYDSFVQFYRGQLGEPELCYVSGERLPATDKHANKIRNAGDKAKLISSNDKSGFTYRGRFSLPQEAASISYDVSQKAHNALKWLINRQAKIIDQRVFLVWGNDELDIPEGDEDSFDLNSESATEPIRKSHTYEELAVEVAKAFDGYRNRLSTKANINILVLDSATTGRMAVLYYRNLQPHFYLDRLTYWHSTCIWLHRYRKNDTGEYIEFVGTPATKDIAFAAYGPRADDKIVKGLKERMLPSVIDMRDIPRDIVNSAFHRASSPESMDKWEWEKTLSIACALINQKERLSVALDYENPDRNYLFGRLLAVADVLERRALGDEKRSTNAIRYMNAFQRHPERTWTTIQASLQPYQARMGREATYWNKIIDEIGSRFKIEEFNNNPLTGLYLLGFYSQRHELYQKKESTDAPDASN
ncbi:type I-C CRISPR-associated protein Cas8c/Csd1 [Paenibacillus ferrarius]|uniref:type I-C CRISPR-associated protein Cas8c/Csd1 n=1 Tax=Paenibacillus ferrarius TaxID=1469647 RepID=UPI003D2DC3E3